MKYGRLDDNILSKSLRDLKQEGFLFFIKKTYRFFLHKILNVFAYNITADLNRRPKSYFHFEGKELPYLIHPYNLSWVNERTVEIPVILDYIKNSKAKNILEVGAVLKHYTKINWEILDKFEKGTGITNQDIVDFKPDKKYDLIISISTLEHVGYDDENKPEKIELAIKEIKKWLSKNGKMIVTVPLGYNKHMDNLIFSNKFGFNKMYFMKRVSRKNKWVETSIEKVRNVKYNDPYNNANAIMIGVY
jgi:hypothetical protein